MAEIIRNVYSFARILSQTETEMVHYWDNRSLENAFNWARYCEKVEAQTQDKAYRDQLDGQLQSLTLLLVPVTLLDLSLATLKHATVYLAKVLLENPSLPDSLRKAVQRETSDRDEIATVVVRERDSRLKSRSISYLLGNDPAMPDTSEGQAALVMQRLVSLKIVSANKGRKTVDFSETIAASDLKGNRSRHLIELMKVLLENPSLPDSLRKAVQRETSDRNEIATVVVRERDSRLKSRSISYLLGNDPAMPDNSEGQAALVMQRLVSMKIVSANKGRYCCFLEEFLRKLTTESVGWEIVMFMLLSEVETEDNHWQIEEIKADILKFISKQNSNSSSIWQVDSDILCEVCSRDDQFYSFYQQYIIQWAESMEPVYGLTDQGALYQWCYKGEKLETKCSCSVANDSSVRHCLCYDSLVRHVCGLLGHQGKKKHNFENSVRELSKQSHFNIWTDVLKSVKERLK